MAERKFAALAELRRRPDPPLLEDAPAPDTAGDETPSEAVPAGPEPEPVAPSIAPAAALAPEPPPVAATVPAPANVPAVVAPDAHRGRGRPPGKRSDPDWAPRTILMRSKIHRRVSIMLLERDSGPDLSELVDQLLTEWISKQT